MKNKKLNPLQVFDARIVQGPLRGLLINVGRDLERRFAAAQDGSDREAERQFLLFLIMVRFTINSYESVCFLLDTEDDDPKRKNRFALVVPPINRQILDLLFTLVYMLDDFPTRSVAYEHSGYRQFREEYVKFHRRYGKTESWQDHFDDMKDLQVAMERYFAITPEQKAKPASIDYWYAPYRLKDIPTKSRPFMRFLEKWLYGETSAQAHLNAVGMFHGAGIALSDLAPEEMRHLIEHRFIRQYIYRNFSRTLTTVLAIASEIDTFCQLQNREQLARLWGLLSGYVEEAKDVYSQRYEAMLSLGPR